MPRPSGSTSQAHCPDSNVVGCFQLGAQTVGAIGDHDSGDAEAFHRSRVPEIRAKAQRCFLLQREL